VFPAGHPTIRLVPDPATKAQPMPFAAELQLATSAARRAGRLQVERYERLESIVHKSAFDVVTEVDEMSEQMIISELRQAYPADGFLAEESGRTHIVPPAGDGGAAGQRMWVIDPLDGTVNYANGIPFFCVSIGLVVAGRPVVGVVYDPLRDDLFTAVVGGGAQLDGRPIASPAKEKLTDAVVSLALSRRGWSRREQAIRKSIRVARVMGSAALSLAYVANGRFDAFVQSGGLSLWDIAGAGVIAIEGGATISRLDGGDWFDLGHPDKSIGLLAAPPAHHQALLEMLQ
jgi:fructose-1,6-bisphosphatase/inositol monophosphatase family enzyme